MKRLSEIYNFLYYLGEVIADSAFYPVDTLDNHQVTIDTVQLKNHLMSSVELTCRGDPGSAFLVSTMRHSTYPAQGSYTLSKALLLENLHNLELDSNEHLHKVATTDLDGKMNENHNFGCKMLKSKRKSQLT